VTPVHKAGSTDDPSYFCPISVVLVVAKLLKKVVATQLSSYLERHKLLSSHQCDSIAQVINRKLSVCVAFLDLCKAFDSLDHHMLLKRLNHL